MKTLALCCLAFWLGASAMSAQPAFLALAGYAEGQPEARIYLRMPPATTRVVLTIHAGGRIVVESNTRPLAGEATQDMMRRFALPPGHYRVGVELVDSAHTWYAEQTLDMPAYTEAYTLSDLDLFTAAARLMGHTVAYQHRTLRVQAEAYTRQFAVLAVRTHLFHRLAAGAFAARYESVARRAQALALAPGAHQIATELPLEGLPAGDYLVEVSLADKSGRTVAAVVRPLVLEWRGLPALLADIPAAVQQMTHAAPPQVLRRLASAQDTLAQREAFMDFWAGRGPRALESYYQAIAVANRTYGAAGIPGWRTDRGAVQVRYGSPDRVEEDKQGVQRWHYRRLSLTFIFRRWAGDYRLDPSQRAAIAL